MNFYYPFAIAALLILTSSCNRNTQDALTSPPEQHGIKKLKYNNRWITNYIKSDMKSDELIDIINFAELNKPDDWLLPVFNIKYKNDLFVVCFGISEHQKTHPNQYRFPRYCLPIIRTQNNGQYEYQAKYDSIEYSELIVD